MPYEVSMSGGQPWGFRMSGGSFSGDPCTISRITPGGKAHQANVMQGDVLVAVNGLTVSDLTIHEVMKYIKESGEEVHLTILSQEEIEASLQQKRQSAVNITTAAEIERPSSTMQSHSPRFIIKISRQDEQIPFVQNGFTQKEAKPSSNKKSAILNRRMPSTPLITNTNVKKPYITTDSTSRPQTPVIVTPTVNEQVNANGLPQPKQFKGHPVSPLARTPVMKEEETEVRAQPTPKPRTTLTPSLDAPAMDFVEEESNQMTEDVEEPPKQYPDYIKRHLKPQKPVPEFKPQVNWLHGKLKINLKGNPNALTDPGNKLKTAAQAHPNQPIEIEGPMSATVVHSQYNTPVGLYSGSQIVNTLVGTAVAKGAKVADAEALCDASVDINKDTPVYKLIHKKERASPAPAQSRSIQILDALLSQPGATLPSAF